MIAMMKNEGYYNYQKLKIVPYRNTSKFCCHLLIHSGIYKQLSYHSLHNALRQLKPYQLLHTAV